MGSFSQLAYSHVGVVWAVYASASRTGDEEKKKGKKPPLSSQGGGGELSLSLFLCVSGTGIVWVD